MAKNVPPPQAVEQSPSPGKLNKFNLDEDDTESVVSESSLWLTWYVLSLHWGRQAKGCLPPASTLV